jgi:tetratricopeptide (TPR) repeat protein
VTEPLIVKFYKKLPQPTPADDADLWEAGVQEAMRGFRQAVKNNYTEGSLQRLLAHPSVPARQGAVLALGLVGTMDSNEAVAGALKDDDPLVRKFAHDALWEIWLRGGTVDHAWQLRQAIQVDDFAAALAALDELVAEAPNFAEAYNQRAILFFRRGEFARSVSDCQAALRLNPFHFGAAAGMGQGYLKLRKPRAALRAFKRALEINPSLDHLRDAVKALSDALDGDGE